MPRIIPAFLLLVLAHAAGAADAAQIRAVADKAGPAVISLRVVTEMKLAMMNQNRTYEHEAEAVGVILDVDGTTAVGMSDLDPAGLMKAMLGGNSMIKIDNELKECIAVLADGSEVAMAVALKDPAMGLAILRPKEPGRTFACLALAEGRRLQLGEHALVVSRAPRRLASTILVNEVQVIGEVAGKQPYALISLDQAMSAAVCDLDGRLVGVVCAREAPAPPADGGAEPDPFKSLTIGIDAKAHAPTPIVLSAEAVAKLVALAKGKGAAKER
jgi:S1-C subfamily serine protease